MNNKLTILLSVFFFFVLTTSYSQFGITLGVNFAKLQAKETETDLKFKTGISGGLFYQFNLDENFSIVPEVIYSQLGVRTEENEIGVAFSAKIKMNYLQIPILAKHKILGNDNLALHILGGPYIGFGLGNAISEQCYNGDCMSDEISYGSNGNEDEIENPDYGIMIGLGTTIKSNFTFDVKYQYGLKNLAMSDVSVQHNALNVAIGYHF